MDSGAQIEREWLSLAEAGDTKQLGKSILKVEVFDSPHFEACTRILMKANADHISANQNLLEKTPLIEAGLVLIEALVQKKAGQELAKLAFLSWNALEKSPLSVSCLDSAIEVGSLDDIYDIGYRMHSNQKRKNVECAANLILKLALAGFPDAYFITGEFYRDGHGLKKDSKEAEKWFLKAAYNAVIHAALELTMIENAFTALADMKEASSSARKKARAFYLNQAACAKKAGSEIFVFVPGQEIDSLIHDGESGKVEFKESAVWEIENLRDVAAFLNSNGGCLLIGVVDDGAEGDKKIIGLEHSFRSVNVNGKDAFENHLTGKLLSNLGQDCTAYIAIDFPQRHGKEICRIIIHPSKRPVYVREKNEEYFFVRTGNSKRKLSTREALEYIRQHKHFSKNS